ncbi:MAG TPA: hypothetical protein VHS59_06055, partial [Bacillota bacterium]|nr:hypothetical protein [Bacillota bacterium]
SSNDNYLRDSAESAPRQTITYVGESVYTLSFPNNLKDAGYKTRSFCIVCHKEYVAGVTSWVYYSSETTPGGQVKIPRIPLSFPLDGISIIEHKAGNTKPCTDCHNPHDPEPVGSNKDCFVCHGATGYVPNNAKIELLTGLNGVWPNGIAKTSYHPITNAKTAILNDCMSMCHTKHVHNPRANLILDRRPVDLSAPGAPTVVAYASSANRVDLQVYAPTNQDTVGYYVYRSDDNVTWDKYAVINSKIFAPASLWFYDGGLQVDKKVYYKAQAFDRKGNVSPSSGITSATPSIAADTTKPNIPLNVSVSQPTRAEMQSSSLVISWGPGVDNYELRRYNIYRATANPENLSGYTLVGTTGGNSISDGLLNANTTYYYRVTAVDANGNESSKSAWVSAKTAVITTVQPGTYYYRGDASGVVTMRVYNPAAPTITTVTFERGSTFKVEVTVPKGYFSRALGTDNRDLKYAKLNFYSMTPDVTPPPNTTFTASQMEPYYEGIPSNPGWGQMLNLTETSTSTHDIYSWSGQVPDTGTVYQLTLGLGEFLDDVIATNPQGFRKVQRRNIKQIFIKEAISVTPLNRRMKTYSDSARTQETLVFKPGDTVYFTAPALPPDNVGYVPAYLGLYKFNGTEKGLWNTSDTSGNGLIPNWALDSNSGHINMSYTLPPAGELTDDCWYSFGLFGGAWRGIDYVDIFRQILIQLPDTSAPSKPGTPVVSQVEQNKVTLSWSASTDTTAIIYTSHIVVISCSQNSS